MHTLLLPSEKIELYFDGLTKQDHDIHRMEVTGPARYDLVSTRPVSVGSGNGHPPRAATNLPKFPNNPDLVLVEGHSQLLSALLPALKRYNCLDFFTTKPRRSPWVRAFCDLYHPAGPWGGNKFSNAPGITDKQRKYNFKSYQIPTIYKYLQSYHGNSVVHLTLKAALTEYFHKEQWHKDFMQGCERVAATHVNKPLAERAAIPTEETGVVVEVVAPTAAAVPAATAPVAAAMTNNTIPVTPDTTMTKVVVDAAKGDAAESTPRARRSKRLTVEEESDSPRPRTRARRRLENVAGFKKEEVKEKKPPKESKASLDSKKPRKKNSNAKNDTAIQKEEDEKPRAQPEEKESSKENLEAKRSDLVDLLAKRQASASGGKKDAISTKIQSRIDQIDEELMDLIMVG